MPPIPTDAAAAAAPNSPRPPSSVRGTPRSRTIKAEAAYEAAQFVVARDLGVELPEEAAPTAHILSLDARRCVR